MCQVPRHDAIFRTSSSPGAVATVWTSDRFVKVSRSCSSKHGSIYLWHTEPPVDSSKNYMEAPSQPLATDAINRTSSSPGAVGIVLTLNEFVKASRSRSNKQPEIFMAHRTVRRFVENIYGSTEANRMPRQDQRAFGELFGNALIYTRYITSCKTECHAKLIW
jgi:hypothetical protein